METKNAIHNLLNLIFDHFSHQFNNDNNNKNENIELRHIYDLFSLNVTVTYHLTGGIGPNTSFSILFFLFVSEKLLFASGEEETFFSFYHSIFISLLFPCSVHAFHITTSIKFKKNKKKSIYRFLIFFLPQK